NRLTTWGDLSVNAKVLLCQGECFNLSAGLSVLLPTARDARYFVERQEVLRLKNDVETLTPYISYLLTPNADWFFQNWVSLNLLREGNPLLLFDGDGGVLAQGKLREQNMLQVDAQLGYWLVSPCYRSGLLRGLSMFGELHYNAALGSAQRLALGDPGFQITF